MPQLFSYNKHQLPMQYYLEMSKNLLLSDVGASPSCNNKTDHLKWVIYFDISVIKNKFISYP